MSRFKCTCGHIIVDITDFLPYKAHFIPDQDNQMPYRVLAKSVVELLNARADGKQREYINGFLARVGWNRPTHWSDALLDEEDLGKVLNGMTFAVWMGLYEHALYECEECGRLWLETTIDGSLASYMPEGDERGVLQSRHHHPPYPERQ